MRRTKIFGTLGFFLLFILAYGSGCREDKMIQPSDTLNICNWEDYFAETTVSDFEKEFGIKVNLECFEDEDYLFSTIQSAPDKYDLIVISDGLVREMIECRLLLPIDKKDINNFSNIAQEFRSLPFDSGNRYSIPYLWGTTGIAINTKFIGTKTPSWNLLWDERYTGKIAMLNNMETVIGAALKSLGFPFFSDNESELKQAYQKLLEQAPLIIGYLDPMEIKNKLVSEDLILAEVYSSDARMISRDNPDIEYFIPMEGGEMWLDNFCIPRDAKNEQNAKLFINYILEPKVGARIAEYLYCDTPNQEAQKILNEKKRAPLKAEEVKGVIEKCELAQNRAEMNNILNMIWSKLKQHKKRLEAK